MMNIIPKDTSRMALCLSFVVLGVQMLPLALGRSFSATAAFTNTRNAPHPPISTHRAKIFHTHAGKGKAGALSMELDTMPSFAEIGSSILVAADATTAELTQIQDSAMQPVEQLSATTTVVVFIIGIVPFIWATWEFWRRIAVGASFGTGSDSVVIPSPFAEDEGSDLITIGEDGNPTSSRGRQTLDRGALTVAYVLFAVAGGSVALAIASVLMGPVAPPM